jgi:YidC/Oxa1 family membrane protein insertase
MEQQRLLLFVALAFIGFLLWQAWQEDYGPKPQPAEVTPQAAQPSTDAIPGEDIPVADTPGQVPAVDSDVPVSSPTSAGLRTAQRIHVETDTLRVEIDTVGGDLRRVDLLKQPVSVDQPDQPFRLMDDSATLVHVAQTGFTAKRNPESDVLYAAPNHQTVYQADNTHFRLADGADTLQVDLHWRSPEGVQFTKTYTFKRDSYLVHVDHKVNNGTDKTWAGNLYRRLLRSGAESETGFGMLPTYTGGVFYTPEDKYNKVDFDDISETDLKQPNISGGWVAMIQHYFLSAWVPPADESQTLFTRARPENLFLIGMYSTEHRVPAGSQQSLTTRLFVGPKLQRQLEDIAPGLDLTVDYGMLTFIAKPLFWILDWIHTLVGNWGWSIILLTVLIKLVFYKLSETSYRSMAKMKKLQPKMMAMRERYGSDRQKIGQAMMELYKKEKVNPLGGCLPILVQIPVFIALYWVLLESAELRQASWILWYKDLSIRDPYFVLPIIMGVTMFLQQKLNPPQADPMQQRIMMMLPIVFTVFFLFFPAGLVLYWVANNVLSIAQQWYITRRVLAEK